MELSDGIQQKLRISGTTILFFFGRNGEFTKVYLWIEWDLTNEKNGI